MPNRRVMIDTRINNKGAEADLKALEAKAKATAKEVSSVDKQIGKSNTSGQKIGADLEKARTKAGELRDELAKVNEQLEVAQRKNLTDIQMAAPHLSAAEQSSMATARTIAQNASLIQQSDRLTSKLDAQEASVATLNSQYDENAAAIAQLESQKSGLITRLEQERQSITDMTNAIAAQQAAEAQQMAYEEQQAAAQERAQEASERFSEAVSGAVRGVAGLGKIAASAFGKIAAGIKKTMARMNPFNKTFSFFSRRMIEILTGALLFNGISAAIRGCTSYLSQAVKSSEEFRGALANLKGAAAIAAAPIVQTLTPAITALANSAAVAMGYIAKLVSFFTGKSISSMQSAAKAMGAYGDATKKAKNELAGFDEINRLGSKDSTVAPNYDYSPAQSELGDSLLSAVEAGDWEGVGKILADKLNEVVAKFDASAWGAKLGKILQHGIDVASEFIRNADWNAIGEKAAQFFNSALEQIDGADVGTILVSKFTIGLRVFGSFLANVDWGLLAQKVSEGLIYALNDIGNAIDSVDWQKLGTGIANGIRSIDYAGIAEAIGYLFGQALKAGIEFVAGAGADLWNWIKETFLAGFNEVFGDPEAWGIFGQNIIVGIMNGILHVIAEIGIWIWENIFKPFADGIADAFDMHSPSRVAAGWGENIGLGMLGGLTAAWTRITAFIEKMRQGFAQGWQNIKSNTVSVFNSLSATLGSIWSGIVSTIRGAVNTIISAINGMIRGVCSGVNGAIDVLNGFSFDVPQWARDTLGVSRIGFNISRINAPQIPYLAQGAVIPPNREFLAVLGDQTGGTNIEAPLETIQAAFNGSMEPFIDYMMQGLQAVVEAIEAKDTTVCIGDDQLARSRSRYDRRMAIIRGTV